MSRPIGILFATILIVVLIMMATQWRIWQTGRVPQTPLNLVSGGPEQPPPGRIWIDTDAACGATARADPDDCFAFLWLVLRGIDIAGVSTSFGNASGDVVTERLAALSAKMVQDGLPVPPIFRGYGAQRDPAAVLPPGVTALRAALETGPLTILALGPLTNIAAALDGMPDLNGNVSRVVAVMGHQPGHLFHPTEGGGAGTILGHGPIFRDLNFSSDPDAAGAVLAMNLPVSLIPYDAAKGTLITGPDLDLLASHSLPQAWVALTSRDWLAFWNTDIGLPGFYPFDWVAAAYLAHPQMFDCAKVTARTGLEWTFWLVPRKSLLVEHNIRTAHNGPYRFCIAQAYRPYSMTYLSGLDRDASALSSPKPALPPAPSLMIWDERRRCVDSGHECAYPKRPTTKCEPLSQYTAQEKVRLRDGEKGIKINKDTGGGPDRPGIGSRDTVDRWYRRVSRWA